MLCWYSGKDTGLSSGRPQFKSLHYQGFLQKDLPWKFFKKWLSIRRITVWITSRSQLFPCPDLDHFGNLWLKIEISYTKVSWNWITFTMKLSKVSILGMGLGQNFLAQGRFGPARPSLVMGPSQNFHGSSISSQNFSSRVEFRAKNFRAVFEPSLIRAANFSSELEQCSSQQDFLSTFSWSKGFHVSKNVFSSDMLHTL